MMHDPYTAPCKWCGSNTRAVALRECYGCWEIRRRVELQPGVAIAVLLASGHLVDMTDLLPVPPGQEGKMLYWKKGGV